MGHHYLIDFAGRHKKSTEAATSYVGHALGLVKSFWPKARLEVLAEGAAVECTGENFREYLLEVRPVAEKIVGDMVQS
jgi:hypothetical protein